jgi:hypothetical protein
MVIRTQFISRIADPGSRARDNIVADIGSAGIQMVESKKQPIDIMGTKLS